MVEFLLWREHGSKIGQRRDHESSSSQAVAARRGPRHRRVCGDAGRYSGIGGWYDPPNRKQCETRILECSQLNSMTFPLVSNSPPLAIQFNARALAQGQLD